MTSWKSKYLTYPGFGFDPATNEDATLAISTEQLVSAYILPMIL